MESINYARTFAMHFTWLGRLLKPFRSRNGRQGICPVKSIIYRRSRDKIETVLSLGNWGYYLAYIQIVAQIQEIVSHCKNKYSIDGMF